MSLADLEERLVAQYCEQTPAQWRVVLYTDDQGTVGGYHVTRTVLDSPIQFFDADGHAIGFFHIFAPAEENARYTAAIAELTARFPRERVLERKRDDETRAP